MNHLAPFVLCAVASVSSMALADKLSDFRDADRSDEGCVTIPVTYGDARSACDHEGPYVHPWCDGDKGPVTCVNEEETRKPKSDIEIAKNRIAELKEKRSKADSNRSNAKTDVDKKKYEDEVTQADKDLYDTAKALESAEKSLEVRKKLVDDTIYTLDKCVSYRRAVLNSFATALDRMRNESETDDIKVVARSLV